MMPPVWVYADRVAYSWRLNAKPEVHRSVVAEKCSRTDTQTDRRAHHNTPLPRAAAEQRNGRHNSDRIAKVSYSEEVNKLSDACLQVSIQCIVDTRDTVRYFAFTSVSRGGCKQHERHRTHSAHRQQIHRRFSNGYHFNSHNDNISITTRPHRYAQRNMRPIVTVAAWPVCWSRPKRLNSWDAVGELLGVDTGGVKEPCIRPGSLHKNGHFWDHT